MIINEIDFKWLKIHNTIWTMEKNRTSLGYYSLMTGMIGVRKTCKRADPNLCSSNTDPGGVVSLDLSSLISKPQTKSVRKSELTLASASVKYQLMSFPFWRLCGFILKILKACNRRVLLLGDFTNYQNKNKKALNDKDNIPVWYLAFSHLVPYM